MILRHPRCTRSRSCRCRTSGWASARARRSSPARPTPPDARGPAGVPRGRGRGQVHVAGVRRGLRGVPAHAVAEGRQARRRHGDPRAPARRGVTASPGGALERSRRLVLPEVVGRGRRAHPDRAALVFAGRTRTHAELHDRAARLAGRWPTRASAAATGWRCCCTTASSSWRRCSLPPAGAVAVPVNFRLAADEVAYILRDSGPPGGRRRAAAGRRRRAVRPRGRATPTRRRSPAPRRRRTGGVDEGDAALMCYTSGTTGRPKGRCSRHGGLVASTLSWIHEMRAGPTTSGSPVSRCSTSAASTGCCRSLPGRDVIVTPSTRFDADGSWS